MALISFENKLRKTTLMHEPMFTPRIAVISTSCISFIKGSEYLNLLLLCVECCESSWYGMCQVFPALSAAILASLLVHSSAEETSQPISNFFPGEINIPWLKQCQVRFLHQHTYQKRYPTLYLSANSLSPQILPTPSLPSPKRRPLLSRPRWELPFLQSLPRYIYRR